MSMPEDYEIQSVDLKRMKKKYNMSKDSDSDFLNWWARNHGLGVRVGTKFKIMKGNKVKKVV